MSVFYLARRPFRFLRALRSLQWQLAVSYAAMAALLCAVMGFVIMQDLRHDLLQQDIADTGRRAATAADLLYRESGTSLPAALAEASRLAEARVCALNAQGTTLACSVAGLDVPAQTSPMPAIDDQVSPIERQIGPVAAPTANQRTRWALVQVDEPLTDRNATEQRVQNALIQLSLILMAVAAGMGLLLGLGLTAPLRALTDAARRLGSGNLNARAPQDGDDEIGELGVGFNRMAAQLQDSFATLESERDTLRTFIADMSHELRTPITALRTFNDLLSQGAVADEDVRDEFINESALQIERLEWLAQNLLDLSRFDAGLAEVHVQRIDLRPLVQRVTDEAKLSAERKGVDLELDTPSIPVFAHADAARMQQAFSNVLLNAIKFTPTDGHIGVTVRREGKSTMIHVADTGPGIPPDELPHIFERFYRGPSTATSVGGSGLGLPIVRSIMHAHQGEVEVTSEVGAGTEVVLSLPAA